MAILSSSGHKCSTTLYTNCGQMPQGMEAFLALFSSGVTIHLFVLIV